MSRILLFFFPLWAGAALAYDMPRAVNNYAHELATCSAYFLATSEIVQSQSPDIARKYKDAGENAFDMSVTLTNQKLALARVEMAVKSIASDLNLSSENLSIILNKYSDLCGQAVTDPDARMKYWTDMKD